MTGLLVRRTVVAVVVVALLIAALLLAVHIPKTIALFLIEAFVAFGAYPLVKRLEQWMPRPAAITIVYAVLIGTLVIVALVVVPITYDQVVLLIGGAPQYVAFAQDAIAKAEVAARHLVGNRVPLPSFTQMEAEVADRVSALGAVLIAQLGAIVVGAVSALIIGTSALILSVFFLLQGGQVRDGILNFVPPVRRAKVDALLRELAGVFGHFVAGQALLCAIVGSSVWVLLAPAHFRFALLVAVLCTLGYAIPFVGMLVAQVVAALGPDAPEAVWRACVRDLDTHAWSPWTALAARAPPGAMNAATGTGEARMALMIERIDWSSPPGVSISSTAS